MISLNDVQEQLWKYGEVSRLQKGRSRWDTQRKFREPKFFHQLYFLHAKKSLLWEAIAHLRTPAGGDSALTKEIVQNKCLSLKLTQSINNALFFSGL